MKPKTKENKLLLRIIFLIEIQRIDSHNNKQIKLCKLVKVNIQSIKSVKLRDISTKNRYESLVKDVSNNKCKEEELSYNLLK